MWLLYVIEVWREVDVIRRDIRDMLLYECDVVSKLYNVICVGCGCNVRDVDIHVIRCGINVMI